jgi:hypothetical protein
VVRSGLTVLSWRHAGRIQGESSRCYLSYSTLFEHAPWSHEPWRSYQKQLTNYIHVMFCPWFLRKKLTGTRPFIGRDPHRFMAGSLPCLQASGNSIMVLGSSTRNGLQVFFNTYILGSILTTIIGSIAWHLVDSAFPLAFLSNPLVYLLLWSTLLLKSYCYIICCMVLRYDYERIFDY